MRDIEWKKIKIWMLAMFPAWKPDKNTFVAWQQELPENLTSQQFVVAVRKHMTEKVSSFPPNIFEIIAKLKSEPKLEARETWIKILNRVNSKGRNAYPYDLTNIEKKAVKLLGGIDIIADSKVGDPFIEKRFLDICNNIKEDNKLLEIESSSKIKRLEGA